MAVCDGKFEALLAMLEEEMSRQQLDQVSIIIVVVQLWKNWFYYCCFTKQGPVVQSMVSLMSSLRGQLGKCFHNFITKYTENFC